MGILQNLSEGTVEYDGIDIRDIDMYSTRKNCVSTLIQNTNYPDTTVECYLKNSMGLNKDEINSLIELLGLNKIFLEGDFRINDCWGNKIETLSGGQKQRILLLKALGKNHGVLILDEPSTGLDAKGTEELIRYISESKNGRMTIIVSHDKAFESVADSIIDFEGFPRVRS